MEKKLIEKINQVLHKTDEETVRSILAPFQGGIRKRTQKDKWLLIINEFRERIRVLFLNGQLSMECQNILLPLAEDLEKNTDQGVKEVINCTNRVVQKILKLFEKKDNEPEENNSERNFDGISQYSKREITSIKNAKELYKKGKIIEALKILENLIKNNPCLLNDVPTIGKCALWAYKIQEWEKGFYYADLCIKIEKDDTTMLGVAVYCGNKCGKFKQALNYAIKYLDLDNCDDQSAMLSTALDCAKRCEEWTLAIDFGERYLENKMDHSVIKSLAHCYLKYGNWKKALEYAEKAYNIVDNDKTIVGMAAKCARNIFDWHKALVYSEIYLEQFEENCLAFLGIAVECAFRLNDFRLAQEYAERYINQNEGDKSKLIKQIYLITQKKEE
jgi:tetratricopeptide (TPR) repeat protein